VPETTGVRAEASRRTRDAIVAATVRIVAREGVAAVTHPPRGRRGRGRPVLDHLALRGRRPTSRGRSALDRGPGGRAHRRDRRAPRLQPTSTPRRGRTSSPRGWSSSSQTEREIAVALYRLQVELLGSAEALEVHREWGERLRAVGERVLGGGADRDPGARRPARRRHARTACGWADSTPASRTSSGSASRSAVSCRRCSAEPAAYAKAGRMRGSGNQRGPLRTGFGWRCMR
jgi:hypothetical protein